MGGFCSNALPSWPFQKIIISFLEYTFQKELFLNPQCVAINLITLPFATG